jgi:hypothetical protein
VSTVIVTNVAISTAPRDLCSTFVDKCADITEPQ